MTQQNLPLKNQAFRWKIILRNRVDEEGQTTIVDKAYTEEQAFFIASRQLRRGYKKKYCDAKTIGNAS
jgi:hypothetical protein